MKNNDPTKISPIIPKSERSSMKVSSSEKANKFWTEKASEKSMKEEEKGQPATSDALCRILEAHQCVKAGCCNSDDKLQNYVEEATVGALFPKQAITVEACNRIKFA